MADSWAPLKGEKYINLTTFRKNGEGVSTPVWFAELDGKIVVYTIDNTGKIKRLRHNAHVELIASNARGKVHGPKLQGSVRIIPARDARRLEDTLNRKYPSKRLLNLLALLRRTPRVYLEISPA